MPLPIHVICYFPSIITASATESVNPDSSELYSHCFPLYLYRLNDASSSQLKHTLFSVAFLQALHVQFKYNISYILSNLNPLYTGKF